MSLRQARMADEIRDVLASEFLGGKMEDPRLSGVSITAVKISPDLQIASVYYRVFDHATVDHAQAGLQRAAGLLRRAIADRVRMRRVPELRFFYDESIENAEKIEKLLQDI